MTSFFELLVVFLFLWLALSNAGMKGRLKSLEDDQRKTRARLEQLERLKNDAGTVAEDQAETAAEQPATEAKTTEAEDVALAQDTKPETARPAETGKTPPATSGPPRAFVFTGALLQQFGEWLRQNWTIALAALSLALGGIFMVQYGVENGLLTPFWRVAGALLLGALLVGAGEVIRRRYGDEENEATRYLPSAFAGAGLITLFSAVLAARLLYGLVSAETTLAGLVLVSVLAVALGWLYGSVLSAVGIIGATAAPFLVGGESDNQLAVLLLFRAHRHCRPCRRQRQALGMGLRRGADRNGVGSHNALRRDGRHDPLHGFSCAVLAGGRHHPGAEFCADTCGPDRAGDAVGFQAARRFSDPNRRGDDAFCLRGRGVPFA